MGDGDLVRLPDGRHAQYWDSGGNGPAVMFFHGCPDTRHAAMTGADAAARVGVRLIAANRPGYGRTDRHMTSQSSVADDALAVADALGVGRFATLGMSVGGPYALGCAARHPDRVRTLGLVAAPGGERHEVGTVDEVVERSRPEFERYAARIGPTDPDDEALARRWVADLPAPDAALLRARCSPAALAASAREALADHHGFLRDAALTFRTWEAQPEEIRVPTHLWYGEHDTNAPPRLGEHLFARMRDARLTLRPTTHLATLLTSWDEILTALLD